MRSGLRVAARRAASRVFGSAPGTRADEELHAHLDMLADDLVRGGMARPEAERQARIRLGGIEQVKESMRDQRRWSFVEPVAQDIRYGARMIRRNRGFTLLAALTLALAIGANTAVLGIIDAVRFRPLRVEGVDRLVQLVIVRERSWQTNIDHEVFARLGQPHRSLAGLCAYLPASAPVSIPGAPDAVPTSIQAVSGRYFQVLGFRPRIGRTLREADDTPGAPPAAVVSEHFWRTRLGRDPGVLGTALLVNGTSFEIVGLMERAFFGADPGSPADVTVPFAKFAGVSQASVQIMGRLVPGARPDLASTELEPAFRGYLAQLAPRLSNWSERDRRNELSQRLDVRPAPNGMGDTRLGLTSPLIVLLALSALVLLAGCANLGGLILARFATRGRELSIRLSLGASRPRLLAQLMTEAALLAMLGGAASLVVGRWTHASLLFLLAPDTAAVAVPYTTDLPVLASTVALTVLCGLLIGIVPALRSTRGDLYRAMRGDCGSTCRGGRAARVALVSQLAVAVVLITGAGLLARTVYNLSIFDAGFERRQGLLVNVDSSRTKLAGGIAELERRILDGIRSVPGIRAAALAGNEVFAGGLWAKTVWVEGRPAPDGDQTCRFNLTGPGFFAVAGIPLLLGREFATGDGPGAPLVAIVNEALAQKYFPGENPIGRRLGDRGPASSSTCEIVGVVANAKTRSLREPALPAVYQPLAQAGPDVSEIVLHIQPAAEASPVAANLRAALRGAVPGLLVTRVAAVPDRVEATFRRERVMTVLAVVLGGVTLLLVCVGVFGAASGDVARRAREIALRMALGARRSRVGWQVTSGFLGLVAGGVAVGLLTTLAASRFLRALLFGVAPTDPATMAAAAAIVTVIAVLATVVPAIRASSIDPMDVLRHE